MTHDKRAPQHTQEIPYGYCHCGCGQKTTIADHNNPRKGHVKGQPKRYIAGHHSRLPFHSSLEEHFWTYCSPGGANECWEWKGPLHENSSWAYGVFGHRNQKFFAHRFSWELHNKTTIPKGMVICHTCDNPRCVNPSHLMLGTHADNVLDKVIKGRHPRGERSSSAKLTEADVAEIRRLAGQGIRQRVIAEQFSIHQTTVSDIMHRKSWKNIT